MLQVDTGSMYPALHRLESILFEVTPTDTLILAGVSVLLLVVAIASSLLPARRAMAVEPMVALRSE